MMLWWFVFACAFLLEVALVPWAAISTSRLIASCVLPLFFMYYGLKRKSLDNSGAAVGWTVAFSQMIVHVGLFCSLATFFVTSSVLTKFKSAVKAKIEDEHKEGGQRNWVQVLCNGGVNLLYALLYMYYMDKRGYMSGEEEDGVGAWLIVASMCSFACCNGDTWASEVGPVLSRGNPYLITTWEEVPKGTNGGVSIVGTVASAVGGLVVAVAFAISSQSSFPAFLELSLLGLLSGLLGSALDSLLGATVQFSGWDSEKNRVVNSPGKNVKRISGIDLLDNHLVNLTSSVLTGIFISSVRAIILYKF
jgi:uncharacterized protein (TIGR00297 family)